MIVAKSFTVRLDDLFASTGEIPDTTIGLDVDPAVTYPDPQSVALLHIASRHEFDVMTFELFRTEIEDHPGRRAQHVIESFPAVYGNVERALGVVFAKPKRVKCMPPWSRCPRCDEPIWPKAAVNMTATMQAKVLRDRPHPIWCLNCGQRFAYEDDRRIRMQDAVDPEAIAADLARTHTQPSVTVAAS